MGRTKQSKQVGDQMFGEGNRINKQYDAYDTAQGGYANEARNRANFVFDETRGNYQKFLNNPSTGIGSSGFGMDAFTPSAENVSRMRGNGVFDEYAKTGGLSEADKGTYRARGIASIGSFYDNLKNQLARQRSIAGGTDPGFDAQTAALARQQSQGAQTAATNTEADILDRVTQGRQWGAGSLSDAERGVVDATQRGQMFGANANLQNRGLNLEALRGLQSLRTDVPGEVAMDEGNRLAGMGQRNAAYGANMDRLGQYFPNNNWFDRNKALLGFGAGIGASFIPGGQFGSLLKKNRFGGPTAAIGGNAGG